MAQTSTPLPAWAGFLSPEEYASFLGSLQGELRQRQVPFTLDQDSVIFTSPATGAREHVDLERLARRCAQVQDPALYPEVLRAQIEELLRSFADRAQLEGVRGNWEAARRVLKVRLFPMDQAEEDSEILLYRSIGGDLAAVLVYDLPNSVASVDPSAAAGWGVSHEALWETALANLRAEAPGPQINRVKLGDTADGVAVFGDSYFVTSRILLLGDLMSAEDFPEGALVIVPHRHAMMFHPITGPAVLDAIQELIPLADEMYREGPAPLSPELYWWRAGRVTLLPTEVDPAANEFVFRPPEEFMAVLDRLFGEEQ